MLLHCWLCVLCQQPNKKSPYQGALFLPKTKITAMDSGLGGYFKIYILLFLLN
nr:MAG TPA: hypothetical protein [Caudoviricetes sp.]